MKQAIFIGLILIVILLSGCITQEMRSQGKGFEHLMMQPALFGSTGNTNYPDLAVVELIIGPLTFTGDLSTQMKIDMQNIVFKKDGKTCNFVSKYTQPEGFVTFFGGSVDGVIVGEGCGMTEDSYEYEIVFSLKNSKGEIIEDNGTISGNYAHFHDVKELLEKKNLPLPTESYMSQTVRVIATLEKDGDEYYLQNLKEKNSRIPISGSRLQGLEVGKEYVFRAMVEFKGDGALLEIDGRPLKTN